MEKTLWDRVLNSYSDNRKSKIENRKWVGLLAIGITFAMCGAAAQAQQLTKIPRIGYAASGGDINNPGRLVEALRQGLRDLGYI